MEQRLCRVILLLGAVHLAYSQIANRIVGGQDGDIGTAPWLVSIRYNLMHACGGSLLTAEYVLTAAHCVPPDHSTSDYDVLAGSTSLANSDSGAQSVLVDQVFRYPGYSVDSQSGDIAVLKLKSLVAFSATVQSIRLPDPNVQFPPGMSCKIAGWGHIHFSVPLTGAQNLQIGSVTIISRKTCNCLYHINPGPHTLSSISQDMMCAGSVDGSVDACQGDSGGPLYCYTNSNWYQAGVISWGDECGTPNRPGVYMAIPAYVDWIRSVVPGVQVDYFTVDQTPQPDNDNGCEAADGQLYAYPNSASMVLITLGMLPLYWLTAYFLTDP
ncbi:prostasin [Eleutherodactylus coqui]|uniref:prostasin n=1 Tax=Eleutherodactylus coqui TaxID=57060 RepID=UPI003463264B